MDSAFSNFCRRVSIGFAFSKFGNLLSMVSAFSNFCCREYMDSAFSNVGDLRPMEATPGSVYLYMCGGRRGAGPPPHGMVRNVCFSN